MPSPSFRPLLPLGPERTDAQKTPRPDKLMFVTNGVRRAGIFALFGLIGSIPLRSEVPVLKDGMPAAEIAVDTRNTAGVGAAVLADAGQWLASSLTAASGATFQVKPAAGTGPAIVIARADAWPEIAAEAKLEPGAGYDAYAVITRNNQVYLLGNSEAAARHAVADLLRLWGFRWFAPSPKWCITPRLRDLTVDLTKVEKPALIQRSIWYAYGMGGDDLKPLMDHYNRWALANRLSLKSPMSNGHSYGNIIQRNPAAFAKNPELFALLPDGTRDAKRSPNARKFCFSNPALIDLVLEDRRKLLAENRKANPAAFMVSVDPSDGEGTCHCPGCKALGTTTDRVFHLANRVAKGLRAIDPHAWVGLYAYSSHRLPPTIAVEPNVYVQVAMGFNRTEFTLPELVERWSKKVGAIGLREYYGVEAWDWGLPGRARATHVAYHEKWIPYYAARKLNAINAETNANWGAQTPGVYVAAQLMWNPATNVAGTVNEFLSLAYGKAAGPMRAFHEKMEAAPPLRPAALLPLFDDLDAALKVTDDPAVRARLADHQAYLIYVAKYRDFDLVQSRHASRDDAYYAALEPLMNYAWRIRMRDTVHYYALARRLCNGLPLEDKRPEFYLASKDQKPVWMHDEAPTDAEIAALFADASAKLRADRDPTVNYSRYFEAVKVGGEDAGSSRINADEREAVARFRGGLRGYLVPAGPTTVRLGIAPMSKAVRVSVFMGKTSVFDREFKAGAASEDLSIDLPRAYEYRVEFTGDFDLRVPPEAPFVFEASPLRPAFIDYSGPHYFYVPAGTTELLVDGDPRLSLVVPGEGRRELLPAGRVEGQNHLVVNVPAGAAGKIWHTSAQTRGQVSLLNVPPLMSFHRHTVLLPREVAEADGLTTGR